MKDSEDIRVDHWQPFKYSLVLLIGLAAGLLLRSPLQKKIYRVLDLVKSDYVDSVTETQLEEKTISLFLQDLDPHSVYLSADKAKMANDQLEGHFTGIGIEYFMTGDSFFISRVIKNSPAEKGGLKAGDRITGLNNEPFKPGKTLPEIQTIIRGKEGTKINIGVWRPLAKKTVNLEVIRGTIPTESVGLAFMINPTVGYIKLDIFNNNTFSEFIEQMKVLSKQGMKKLVFDLRNNSGGYMQEAEKVLNEFLAKNDTIVYTKGLHRPVELKKADGKGQFQKLPLVVLINENSASASEVVAGCLQDLDRAVIMANKGSRSFGKGLVQEVFNLGDGSALRLTIARYYTPSGRSIQKPYNEYEYWHDTDRGKAAAKLYHTRNGRSIKSNGGIEPDKTVTTDSFGQWYVDLRKVFAFERAVIDLNYAVNPVATKYKTPAEFASQFQLTEAIAAQISSYLKARKLNVSVAQIMENSNLKNHIKAEIAGRVFEQKGKLTVAVLLDPLVASAAN